jgi:plasmid stabilization system protein ParE
MSQFILSSLASRDLDETWEYIAADNIDAADRWVSEIEKALRLLADRPALGHTRKDLTRRPVLFWSAGRYLIIYRADRQPIEVVRIVSAYRDISRLLP